MSLYIGIILDCYIVIYCLHHVPPCITMSCIHCINPEMLGGNPEAPLSYSSSTIFVAPTPLKAESHTSPISGQL